MKKIILEFVGDSWSYLKVMGYCFILMLFFLFTGWIVPPSIAAAIMAMTLVIHATVIVDAKSLTKDMVLVLSIFVATAAIFGFATLYAQYNVHDVSPIATVATDKGQSEAASTIVGKTDEFGTCAYFSIVTWTTLGYGDVQPTKPIRLAAALEAICGYFFMAVVLGQFISAPWNLDDDKVAE